MFLFSLPCSSSTSTQRLLATHEQIATASESWILLPDPYALRSRGVYADYETHARKGIPSKMLRRR